MKPICVRAITGDTLHGCLPSLSAKSRTWKSAGVRERLKEGRNTRGKQRGRRNHVACRILKNDEQSYVSFQ